jgi:exonuclease III
MPPGNTICHPPHKEPQTPGTRKKSLRLRANITITTLNINGYSTPSNNMTGIEKWLTINWTINENRIAILALQETHLDQSRLQDVQACFGRRLEILHSQHPTNPHASARVAFVINKSLIKPRELRLYELQEGHAIALKVKWLENEETTLINMYTPNNRSEHPNFWETLDTKRRSLNLQCPEFLLGDFNLTEEAIDHTPAHHDDLNAVGALRILRHQLDIQDTWRHTFPEEQSFTYRANANGQHIQL